MLAILGPRSINEAKFSGWETRLTVMGLTWDTKKSTMSIPRDKIDKGVHRIAQILRIGKATRNELQRVLGSLRYITTCIRTAMPFFQHLQTATRRWPRFGRICLTKQVLSDLRWFDHILRHGHLSELPLCMFGSLPTPQFHVYMDASDMGLAILNPAFDEYVQFRFDSEELQCIDAGSLSINVREHMCIALAIGTWGRKVGRANAGHYSPHSLLE
ncbi:hypothetical protein PR003_g5931 [Phytophthora rubi]|uniref:Uncharacterized protein n=1 Tax=Phytophthora rubi TaxID=129364 RepID=A0A6A4G3J6_9STRA|nr:hypothetical protein PR001_g6895 [Phytophthora rubi]KAE9349346.1 hypothetical protein PR003_g5931 [Phytophthora rubi]